MKIFRYKSNQVLGLGVFFIFCALLFKGPFQFWTDSFRGTKVSGAPPKDSFRKGEINHTDIEAAASTKVLKISSDPVVLSDQTLSLLYKNTLNQRVKALWDKKMEVLLTGKDPSLLIMYRQLQKELSQAEAKAILVDKAGDKELNLIRLTYFVKVKKLLGPKLHKEYILLQKEFNRSMIRSSYAPKVAL